MINVITQRIYDAVFPLKACKDGRPVYKTTERMYPLQCNSGLQEHSGETSTLQPLNLFHRATLLDDNLSVGGFWHMHMKTENIKHK